MSARATPVPREILLRSRVEFTQFGITRAGRVIGISHDVPMRYDLKLEDGVVISNILEPDIRASLTPRVPPVKFGYGATARDNRAASTALETLPSPAEFFFDRGARATEFRRSSSGGVLAG